MQIKIVTCDVRLSENTKRAIRWILLPVAVLAGSMAIARAYDTSWIVSGQSVSAANLKADLDAIQTQLGAISGETHSASALHAWLTAVVSVPNNASSPVAFDHVDFDSAHEYVPATGVFTAQQPGKYLVVCAFEYETASVGGVYAAEVSKNGARVAQVAVQANVANSITPAVTTLVQLNAGDSLQCLTYQNSGGSVALSTLTGLTELSVARLY